MRLHLAAKDHGDLRRYLFDAAERVAFLFTREASTGDAEVVELRLLEERDYAWRHKHGVELADHVRPGVIRAAHEQHFAVVEAHAHGWRGPSTRFSYVDLDGLQELGPHMTWRLPGRPYTALVLGLESFDALVWGSDGSITGLEALVVDGAKMRPTGLSLTHLADSETWGLNS
jgi:hypothetical protein